MKVEVLIRRVSLVLMLLPCLSIGALAQTSGVGTIIGSVKDSTGAVIPGVAVSLTSAGTVGGNQQVITDETGGFRFIKLIPGKYGVRAELAGFRTSLHDNVTVDADVTARVDMALEVGTVSDTVNVTSEAVLVDTTTSLHQAVMDKSAIDALPLREDMWNIAKVVPGLILNQYDTAGDKAYTQSTITVHGANQTSEGAFTMDGFEFGSALNGGGDLAMYVPPQNYQEINYQGGNATAENQRGGVVYNFVTRTGTNDFHGDFSFSGTQAALQSNNISATDRANFLASLPASVVAANPNYNPSGKINGLYDADLAVTGPVIKNRVWFSATGFLGQLNSQQVGSFNPDGSSYVNYNQKKDWSTKISIQLTPNQQLHIYHQFNQKVAHSFRAATLTTASATTCQCPNKKYFETIKWTDTITPKLVAEAGASLFHGANTYTPQPGLGPGSIPYVDQITGLNSGAAGTSGYGINPNQRRTAIASLSYLSGKHEIKMGYQYVGTIYHTNTYELSNYPAGLVAILRSGVASSVQTYNTPLNYKDLEHNQSFFVQDKWTATRKVTVSGGLRFTKTENITSAACQPTTIFVTGQCYGDTRPPSFFSARPRVAVVYDVFGTGKTALKFNLSQYDAGLGDPYLDLFNPLALRSDTRTWTDSNKDLIPQLSELGPSSGFSANHNRANPNLKRPFELATSVELEQALPGDAKITVGFYHHEDRQAIGLRNLLVPATSYIPMSVTETNSGKQVTVYNQAPSLRGQFDNYYDNDPEVNGHFNGFDLVFTKRMSHHWLFNGGASFGRNMGDIYSTSYASLGDLNNPNFQFRRGALPTDVPSSYRASGLYQLPYGVDVSATALFNKGFPTTQSVSVGSNTVPLTQTTQSITILPTDSIRLPNVSTLDLSFRRTFKFADKGNYVVKPVLDILNVTNVDTPTARTSVFGSSYGRITGILRGRTIRLGLNASF